MGSARYAAIKSVLLQHESVVPDRVVCMGSENKHTEKHNKTMLNKFKQHMWNRMMSLCVQLRFVWHTFTLVGLEEVQKISRGSLYQCMYRQVSKVQTTHTIRRLTELIKQLFGVLELYKWFTTKPRMGHETNPEK